MQRVQIIDTHTGGEPTRVVVAGGPDLGLGTMAQRAEKLTAEHDWLRRALILEPRGCDWMVGAILQEPLERNCVAGVIFFNNAGCLGMCGHGLIGVVEALAYQGRICAGEHEFETPVGNVTAKLHPDGSVSLVNVESYRWRTGVRVELPGDGDSSVPGFAKSDSAVVGDIAWGGNWFFLSEVVRLDLADLEDLTRYCRRIRRGLQQQSITGEDGAEIDHIELYAPAGNSDQADARNFVLCPGGEYDRSPCGTGTSAKLACLAADGLLKPGDVWRQASIVGSVFEGTYVRSERGVIPRITGRAYVTAEQTCIMNDEDPFRFGIARLG